jgi:hypothetical protein
MPKPSNQPIDLLKFSSGLGLTAANPRIHSKLIQILSVKPNLPLDIFEQAEVLREEHYFGPAYAFFCNGTAPYTYDAAMYVKRTWTEDSSSGNTAWQTTKTETDTQWQPVSSSVSLSKTIYVTGNSDYADQIDKLFNTTSIDGKLVGINELGLPADAVLLGDNLSEQQAYTRHAVPSVKEQLRFQADAAMKTASKGKETRNFHMSDASVQKDSAVDKVLLGSYCVILGYRGQEYPVWLSGDGSSGYADALPRDSVQERLIADKKREQENIPPAKTGLLTLGIVGGMLLAFFGYASPYHIGSLLGLALAAACFVFRFQKSKEYRNRYDAVQKEIDALTSRFDGIAKDFKNRRQALKGIYRNVSGDPSAF